MTATDREKNKLSTKSYAYKFYLQVESRFARTAFATHMRSKYVIIDERGITGHSYLKIVAKWVSRNAIKEYDIAPSFEDSVQENSPFVQLFSSILEHKD